MPVSQTNSRVVYNALKGCGIGLVSALPETWLVHLIGMAEDDPEMILVRLAKEEEGGGLPALVPREPPSRGPPAHPRAHVGGRLTMQRQECLRTIYHRLDDCLVVTIMGAVAAELQFLGHRPNFFYLQHAMGLASSTGLGLALCLPEQRVIVIDGDGSLLMNLGSLSTMARYRPKKLVHIVFDNESLLSVGGFPTATSTGTDLEGIARSSGIPRVATVRSVENFKAAVSDALRRSELTTIVAKVEATGPAGYVTDLS